VVDDPLGDEHGGVGLAFGLMTILLASVIGVIAFALTISSPSNAKNGSLAGLPFTGSVPSVPGSSSAGLSGIPSASEAAACEADARSVAVAVQAYSTIRGSNPAPGPWSAASYAANYAPLTTKGQGGSLLPSAPATTHYVVEFDSAGNVWVEPPGQFDATYNPAHNFDVSTACSSVSR
jgi:hypothetical protein